MKRTSHGFLFLICNLRGLVLRGKKRLFFPFFYEKARFLEVDRIIVSLRHGESACRTLIPL